jgi:lipopolysaccharide/colanic/teichoic acid biosynthesis glycosyltransferase
VADMHNMSASPTVSELQVETVKNIYWIDFSDVYELVFDRVSLESFNPALFIERSRSGAHVFYDFLKRTMDLFLGFILSLVGLVLYPFVYMFVKFDDGGSVFIPQVRVGENEQLLTVYKLRTMRTNDARSGNWIPEGKNVVTRAGHILRKMSLDEVPQVFNVFRGTMSLIGPRADIEGLGKRLKTEIPNYTLRTLIKPGISGWAQIQQIYKKGNISPQSVEETELRLSYDLFYIKHRSVFLDINIALRTITILLSRIFS